MKMQQKFVGVGFWKDVETSYTRKNSNTESYLSGVGSVCSLGKFLGVKPWNHPQYQATRS